MRKLAFVLSFVLIPILGFSNNNLISSEINTNEYYSSTQKNSKISKITYQKNQTFEEYFDFKICKITHNVVDDEGNLLGTVNYTVETDGSCQEASDALKKISVIIVMLQ